MASPAARHADGDPGLDAGDCPVGAIPAHLLFACPDTNLTPRYDALRADLAAGADGDGGGDEYEPGANADAGAADEPASGDERPDDNVRADGDGGRDLPDAATAARVTDSIATMQQRGFARPLRMGWPNRIPMRGE